jgi:hypothetical protein
MEMKKVEILRHSSGHFEHNFFFFSLTRSLHVCGADWGDYSKVEVYQIANYNCNFEMLSKVEILSQKTLNDSLWSPSLMACVICR